VPTTLHSTTDTDTTTQASASFSSIAARSNLSADPSALARSTSSSQSFTKPKPKRRLNQTPELPDLVPEQRETLLLASTQHDDNTKLPHVSTEELSTPSTGPRRSGSETLAGEGDRRPELPTPDQTGSPSTAVEDIPQDINGKDVKLPPQLVLQEPTPDTDEVPPPTTTLVAVHGASPLVQLQSASDEPAQSTISSSGPPRRSSSQISPRHQSSIEDPDVRRQSILNSANAKIVNTLVDAPANKDPLALDTDDSLALPSSLSALFTPGVPNMSSMLYRRIWVRRPGSSPTLVKIKEDDLVDDVRDLILGKYANSLGKTFDSPDMLLRIVSRGDNGQPRTDRVLGPEEQMCRTIDAYFPEGQTVEDALVIDVPSKRTPRPSPRYHHQYQNYAIMEDSRPVESGSDYFPPMPAIVHPTMPQTAGSHDSRPSVHSDHHRSISVLNTGQLPLIPSPGGTRRYPERVHRPRFNRQHTSSPTTIQHSSNTGAVAVPSGNTLAPQQQPLNHRGSLRPRTESVSSEHPHPHMPNGVSAAAPMSTPPVAEAAAPASNPPTPSTGQPAHPQRAPRPKKSSRKPNSGYKSRKNRNDASESPQPSAISSMLDASIPPINVLIVEDNIINLRILEGLMKRLKVRWETAMNGQIAVDKWRGGGFHLVLMDIQMPVMNGLAATKEIRRLEKVNGIGVFSSSAPSSPAEQRKSNGDQRPNSNEEDEKEAEIKRKKSADKLPEATGGMFKSPIIIVALTASSLQSDRHEALAAGCNDFLTKPVNFVWLERKVKEWGCMQALIDFDGWRRWKDYASKEEAGKTEEQKAEEREKEEKQKKKMEKLAILQEKQRVKKEAEDAKKKAERERIERENAEKEDAAANADADDDSPTSPDVDSADTEAEVAQEKKEIEMGEKAYLEGAEPNPAPEKEPPVVSPETIKEEE
jgi:osomolarity two-component system response regulator SSK1